MKTNSSWRTIFISISLMALVSCSAIQIGQNFELNSFTKNVVAGKTTKQQVTQWLGNPLSTGISHKESGERLTVWDYFYGSGELPSMKNTKIKMLQIQFDNKGILRSYNWSDSK